jgi:CBS domain-containing protein
MPNTVTSMVRREAPLLRADETVGDAVRRLLESGLPALPVVDASGRSAGIFGEREFVGALFPAYLQELRYAAFVPASLEDYLDKRAACRLEPVSSYMNTEHVEMETDASDAHVAETFLHHRVLILPVVDEGRPVGLVTRADFFRAVAERFLARADD